VRSHRNRAAPLKNEGGGDLQSTKLKHYKVAEGGERRKKCIGQIRACSGAIRPGMKKGVSGTEITKCVATEDGKIFGQQLRRRKNRGSMDRVL